MVQAGWDVVFDVLEIQFLKVPTGRKSFRPDTADFLGAGVMVLEAGGNTLLWQWDAKNVSNDID